MTAEIPVGVLGGSGVYDLDRLRNAREISLDTPFGAPSDRIVVGEWEGVRTAFLPRHGRGHRLTPSEVPYRANLWALRALGVHRLLSLSAVGSLCEEYAPGDFVLVDQFVDRTFRRETSFFGGGAVVHVPLAEPVCVEMARVVQAQAAGLPVRVHRGGTYVCIEGPQFSTRAESHLHRVWGCKIVGMTNVTEAKLAREAGMSFCCVAMVTDYDCWHPQHGDVDVATVLEVAGRNARNARDLVRRAIGPLAALGPSRWRGIARAGLLTAPEAIPPETRARVGLLLDLPA
jgi:5'-methylthioadenosine phosphorylase